ncbi:MAG: DUF1934 domain-containing protein [Oscillospiraceae bacterium]
MKSKDVLIKIKGTHIIDDDKDTTEITTIGNFYKKQNLYYISYQESEATGFKDTKTTMEISKDSVTLTRKGTVNSQLIIENGIRHQCCYDTGYGDIVMGISGESMDSSLTDEGGELSFRYALDVNSALASINIVEIQVAADCGGL